MIVSIGTRSIPKIIAITRAFSYYPEIWMKNMDKIEYTIMPKELKEIKPTGQEQDSFSEVSCNPLTLKEIISGAKTRAKKAFKYSINKKEKCDFGVGIEAGMFPVEEVETKFMDASICAIYDGEKYYIGFSPSFEYPPIVVKRVLKNEEIGLMEDVFGNTAKR